MDESKEQPDPSGCPATAYLMAEGKRQFTADDLYDLFVVGAQEIASDIRQTDPEVAETFLKVVQIAHHHVTHNVVSSEDLSFLIAVLRHLQVRDLEDDHRWWMCHSTALSVLVSAVERNTISEQDRPRVRAIAEEYASLPETETDEAARLLQQSRIDWGGDLLRLIEKDST